MPIPGSVLNNLLPFGVDAVAGVYESVATLMVPSSSDSGTGQIVNTFADTTDSTYVNMPCRKAPYVLERPREQEFNRPRAQEFEGRFHLNIGVYIAIQPEVLSRYKIKVDTVVYQIVSVEPDGSSITTRLLISDTVPYVE